MKNSCGKTNRNVSIDSLKVLSMIMVVVLHATQYGVEKAELIPWTIPYCLVTISKSVSIAPIEFNGLIKRKENT